MMLSKLLDPVDEMLRDEAAADHARAAARGARIERTADAVISALRATTALSSTVADEVYAAVFKAVADEFYGNAAIDLPARRKGGA